MAHNYRLGPDIDLDAEEVYDRDGERITEARAEEIAEETLAKAGRPGRPTLGGTSGSSPTVRARISPTLNAQLTRYAAQHGEAHSDVLREALRQFLASHETP